MAAVCLVILLVAVVAAAGVSDRHLGMHADVHLAQPPLATAPLATTSALTSSQQCEANGGATLLTRFVEAFNQNDQPTLEALLVDQPLSVDAWIAAVTSPSDMTSGDVLADSQTGFLDYVARRHQQGEQLRISRVIDVHPAWLPDYINVVADLQRTARDLPAQQVRAVAMLSCTEQQIGAWSLAAAVETSDARDLTGDTLVADTLHQRPLHLDDDVPAGVCPVNASQTVDPRLAPALGIGPIYVVLGGAAASGALHLQPDAHHDGWTRLKALWTSHPAYTGPILIHGGEIGGSNSLGFGANFPLNMDPYFSVAPHGDIFETGYVDVKAPGCYALQIDGVDFSEIIVFQVQP
ncbi:MAG TPA: hypothetical protein VF201_04955 [Nitrolancea sp.]